MLREKTRVRCVPVFLATWWMVIPVMGQASPDAAAPPAAGQPADTARGRDPLAIKQQIVRDRMTQLEDRMFRLTEKLAQTEPEQARKLEAAMKRAQEMLVRRNMEDAIALLEGGRLTDASDRQSAALKGLEGVLKILLEEGDNTQQRQAEIDRLQAYQNEVRRVLDNERKLKAQSEAAPRLGRMLAGIQAAIARLEALIEREQKQIGDARAAAKAADADRLAEAQRAIREETESVAKGLENPGDEADRPGAGADTPAGDTPRPENAAGPSRSADRPDAQEGHRSTTPGGQARPAGESGDRPSGEQPGDDPPLETPGGQQPTQPGDNGDKPRPSAGGSQGDRPQGGPQQGAPSPGGQQQQDARPRGDRPASGEQPQSGQPQGGQEQGAPQQGGQRQSGQQQSESPSRSRSPSGQNLPSEPQPGSEAEIEAGLREARNDVKQAADQMQTAEAELGRDKVPDALPMQEKSVESLRRALRELRKQEEALRKQLDQAEAARRQRELERETRELAEQMRNGQDPGGKQAGKQPQDGQPQGGQPQGGQQQGGQQQGGQQQNGQRQGNQQQSQQRPQEPIPGNQNVERAGEQMDRAADELDRDRPGDAAPEQQQAIDQLEQAQRELDQALDQLRREQQEEILRGLESRFRAMLAAQIIINDGTLNLDKKGAAAWDHADELKLAALAQDQAGVSEQAGQSLHILREEGTTVVFPRIVEQLAEDMTQVSVMLRDKKTGARTQRTQADIVTTLQEMIGSIKAMRQKIRDGEAGGNQQQNGGNAGQSQNPPLLPGSAELKLLRSCQQRVTRETAEFDGEHTDPSALDDEARGQLQRIAERQQDIAEMARKMNERITGQ